MTWGVKIVIEGYILSRMARTLMDPGQNEHAFFGDGMYGHAVYLGKYTELTHQVGANIVTKRGFQIFILQGWIQPLRDNRYNIY